MMIILYTCVPVTPAGAGPPGADPGPRARARDRAQHDLSLHRASVARAWLQR